MTIENTLSFKTDADIINDLANRAAHTAQLDKRSFEQKLDELRNTIAHYIAGEFEGEIGPKLLPYKMEKLLDFIGTTFELTQILILNLQCDIASQTGHELPDEEDMTHDET